MVCQLCYRFFSFAEKAGEERKSGKKRREGSDAALLLVCVRLSCKLIFQTQDISSKMGMDSTANAKNQVHT